MVSNAQDMMDMLADNGTSIRLFHHTEQDIGRMRALVPGKLSPLSGALQLHRVSITKEGMMTTRQMPTDYPKQLNIRVITRAPTATAAEPLEPEQ